MDIIITGINQLKMPQSGPQQTQISQPHLIAKMRKNNFKYFRNQNKSDKI